MEKLIVSASPHIRSSNSTQKIMLDVLIGLSPALIASVILFGYRALIVTLTCVVSSVVFEYLCRKIMKRDNTIA
ncbi:MAG TPA: RnfABCDGE type electron transport complex subunit D, partial [Firmicutes bacterium]|nr:RnfABCDGE type electron transport complex subunit D [Bacillota bacterium]